MTRWLPWRKEGDEGTQDVLEDNKSSGSGAENLLRRNQSLGSVLFRWLTRCKSRWSTFKGQHIIMCAGKRRQKQGRKRTAGENNDAIKNGNKSRARMHMKLFHLCDFYVQLAVRKVQLTLHLLARKVSEKRSGIRETWMRWKKCGKKLWNEIIFRVIIRSHTAWQCTNLLHKLLKISKSLSQLQQCFVQRKQQQASHRMICLCKRKASCAPWVPKFFTFSFTKTRKKFLRKIYGKSIEFTAEKQRNYR